MFDLMFNFCQRHTSNTSHPIGHFAGSSGYFEFTFLIPGFQGAVRPMLSAMSSGLGWAKMLYTAWNPAEEEAR